MHELSKHIVFICGSVKSGADGVGDYTLRLASELMKQGHEVSILAFNDHYTEKTLNENLSGIDCLRLPMSLSSGQKIDSAKAFLDLKKPDLVSLQFVLYAYNDKGLPFKLSNLLGEILNNIPVEIMFHELWLGMEKKPVLKDKIYGHFQASIFKKIIKSLNPICIHTHSQAYKQLLEYHDFQVKLLPLFTNIPVISARSSHENQKGTALKALIFGYISEGAPVKEFIQECRKSGINLELILAGKNGHAAMEWKEELKKEGIPFKELGILSAQEISELMNSVDFGISTTPYLLYEKSGSVSAMLAHGLPVLHVSPDWDPETQIQIEPSEFVKEYKPGSLQFWFENHCRIHNSVDNLFLVAEKFISDTCLTEKEFTE